jgi:hypothetical protein
MYSVEKHPRRHEKSWISEILVRLFPPFVICILITTFAQAQNTCEVRELRKPRFSVAYASYGETLLLRVVLRPKLQTDENLLLMANYLKNKFCKDELISVTVFDNKKAAREFTVYEVKQVPETLRAIYRLNRAESEEYLVRIKVEDGQQVASPVRPL